MLLVNFEPLCYHFMHVRICQGKKADYCRYCRARGSPLWVWDQLWVGTEQLGKGFFGYLVQVSLKMPPVQAENAVCALNWGLSDTNWEAPPLNFQGC